MDLFQSNRKSGHFLALGSTSAGKSCMSFDLTMLALAPVTRHMPAYPIKGHRLDGGKRCGHDAEAAPSNAPSKRIGGRDSSSAGN